MNWHLISCNLHYMIKHTDHAPIIIKEIMLLPKYINFLDFSMSPNYKYKKYMEASEENLYFDIRARVKGKYLCPCITDICIPFSV